METLRKKSARALTLIEVLIVVAVVAILAVLLLPYTTYNGHASSSARRMACANNLLQVDLGFRLWTQDNSDKFPMQVSMTNGGSMESAAAGDVAPVFQVVSNELKTPKILVCPADSRQFAATFSSRDFSASNVSYFVNRDASVDYPQMFLSGDRKLTTNGVPVNSGILVLTTNQVIGWTQEIHQGRGNIAFTDGHVQSLSNSALNRALQDIGSPTNRLVIP